MTLYVQLANDGARQRWELGMLVRDELDARAEYALAHDVPPADDEGSSYRRRTGQWVWLRTTPRHIWIYDVAPGALAVVAGDAEARVQRWVTERPTIPFPAAADVDDLVAESQVSELVALAEPARRLRLALGRAVSDRPPIGRPGVHAMAEEPLVRYSALVGRWKAKADELAGGAGR